MSRVWKRLIRFIPKNENVVHYGEPIYEVGKYPRYFPRNLDGIKSRVLSIERITDEVYQDIGIEKEIDDIVAPIFSTHMYVVPYANYDCSYIVNKIKYPRVFGYKLIYKGGLREFGGPKSNLLLPVCNSSTIIQAGVHLAVIIKNRISKDSQEEIQSKILGYSVGMDITRQEVIGYRNNPTAASIRDVTTYSLIGPCIVSPDKIKDVDNLGVCLSYDSTILQSSNTSNTVLKTYKFLQHVSKGIDIMEGSVVFTGTPEPNELNKKFGLVEIKDGKTIVASIENIGFLDVTIRLIPSPPLIHDVKISDQWKTYIEPSSGILSI